MSEIDHTTSQLLRELIHEIRMLRADMNRANREVTYGPGSPAYWSISTTSGVPGTLDGRIDGYDRQG